MQAQTKLKLDVEERLSIDKIQFKKFDRFQM